MVKFRVLLTLSPSPTDVLTVSGFILRRPVPLRLVPGCRSIVSVIKVKGLLPAVTRVLRVRAALWVVKPKFWVSIAPSRAILPVPALRIISSINRVRSVRAMTPLLVVMLRRI